MENQKQTLGEYRVGTNFNPSQDSLVDVVKQQTANLIDLLQTIKYSGSADVVRLVSLAQTEFENAAMWAVKAITKKPYNNEGL